MWDDRYGGWYRLVSRQGEPMEAGIKHLHGTAYGISACVNYYLVTGDHRSLETALAAFHWWDARARDSAGGGYFSLCDRKGALLLEMENHPLPGRRRDHLGVPLGWRDPNSNTDMLESLTDLYTVTSEPLLRERLSGLYALFRDRLFIQPGVIAQQYQPGWVPVAKAASSGFSLQVGMQMLKASRVLGDWDAGLERLAAIVDAMLESSWDGIGGGVCDEPGDPETTGRPSKIWWHQAEALRAFVVLMRTVDRSKYEELVSRLWRYIQTWIVDPRRPVWDAFGRDGHRHWNDKANVWKDSSHEVRALIESIRAISTGEPVLI
jgi:mannobiose 2-epimerase